MIIFPNAKINFGLNILTKRTDGYHNIETVFYPIPLFDILEIIPYRKKTIINCTGINIPCNAGENLAVKAYRLLANDYTLSQVQMHLHKQIPPGSGLGGGSSDGVFALLLLNKLFNLNMPAETLKKYALQLGSDCPFFLHNAPVYATGRGEILNKITLNLSGYYIVLVIPPHFISTAEAYRNTEPVSPEKSLLLNIQKPVRNWKHNFANRFEPFAFQKYPVLQKIKDKLYQSGAIFASMSGSGAAMFGIFEKEMKTSGLFPDCGAYCMKLSLGRSS